MRSEDVMKALECCTFTPKCEECPLGGEGCITLDQHALALLREKDAEIERLERICDSYALQYGSAVDKEVLLKQERADTVRKMQERFSTLLEKEYKQYTPEGADHYFKNGSYMMWGIAERAMHQIAKEMVEVNE